MIDGPYSPDERGQGNGAIEKQDNPPETPQRDDINEDVREPDGLAWESIRQEERETMKPLEGAFNQMPGLEDLERAHHQHEHESPEARIEGNVQDARRIMIDIIKSKPGQTIEAFASDIKTHIDYIEALAHERGGEDEYVWLWYQELVSYDKFAEDVPEFDHDYIKSLKMVHYFIKQLVDPNLADKWQRRLASEKHG